MKAHSNLLFWIAISCSFLEGILLRVFPLSLVGFDVPFDMGGLFYQMSLEIIRNGFKIPATIPFYYPGGLPFVYPPFPFYIQAILIKLINPDKFILSNLLPPVFSIISLFAFYFLAKKIFHKKSGVVAAVFTFSIMPIAFTEQIQAMGLAESIGTLVLILYVLVLVIAAEKKRTGSWILSGLTLGLCVLTSPGSIYAAILISILFFGVAIFYIWSKKDISLFKGCVIVGGVGFISSSPYWLTAILRFGIDIFLKPFTAQNTGLIEQVIIKLSNLELIHASLFWNILLVSSLILVVIRRKYLLFLFSLLLLPIPREHWIMSIPASLVIGEGVAFMLDILRPRKKPGKHHIQVAVAWILIMLFSFDSFISLMRLIDEDMYDISAAQIAELETIKHRNLIPVNEQVIVVGNWGLIEWSPAILEREVINNPFGLEWLPERNEIMLQFKEDLPDLVEPDLLIAALREHFDDIERLYVISDRDHIQAINDTEKEGSETFSVLADFDTLGLGILMLPH